jgi:hypothetical protein
MKIAHDNELLVKRLTEISRAAAPPAGTPAPGAGPPPGHTASAAVNRRRGAAAAAAENLALYQRLVAIRPSKDISRDTLGAAAADAARYRANASKFGAGRGGHGGGRARSPPGGVE